MGPRESLTQATEFEAKKDASRGCDLREPERLDGRDLAGTLFCV